MEIGNIFRHLLFHNEAFIKNVNTDATKSLAYATHQTPYITLLTCINGVINLIDLQDKARAIIKRIPNYDEASQGYKIACHLVEEKVTRITV